MRNYILFIVLATLLVGSKARAESSVPHLINMQSIVYDADGNLTKSDRVNLLVRILDEANNILYTESHAEVPVVEGAINIAIGDSGDTGGIPLEVLDPSKGTRLIDIEVDGQSAFELMPLSAVPYSMWSEKALTVAADSIGSEEIKDGSIKLVDLADEIKFSDIKGIADPNQLPASLATVEALNGHINSATAHTASTIVVSGNFVTFVAANVQEALQKIDAKLADEVANRQGGQGDIGSALKTEIKNRTDGDTILQSNLDTHTLAATAHGSDGTVVGLNTLTIKVADHAALTQGVHGLSALAGNTVVGTTETQTLENKTLTSPTINGGTIDGATITNSSFSGDGSNITNLNGSNIASGTIDDARLSANVTKLGSTIEGNEITDGTIGFLDLDSNGCANGQVMKSNGSVWTCGADNNSGGTVTGIAAGTGLTTDQAGGNPITGSGTISIKNDSIMDASINSAANIGWGKISKAGATAADVGAAGAGHNHDSDYVNVTGDTMTGNLDMAAGRTVDGVDVSGLESRVNTNDGKIANHETRITALEGKSIADNSIGVKKFSNQVFSGSLACSLGAPSDIHVFLEEYCEDPAQNSYSIKSLPSPAAYLPMVWVDMTGQPSNFVINGAVNGTLTDGKGFGWETTGQLKYSIGVIQRRRDYDGGPDEICLETVLTIENGGCSGAIGGSKPIVYKVYKVFE